MTEAPAAEAVKNWVERIVVGLNFCPFAHAEIEQQRVRYRTLTTSSSTSAVDSLVDECLTLDQDATISTTLLVFEHGFVDFDDFLHLIDEGQRALAHHHYSGIYQLAHFHPDYCFEGLGPDDAANYTNRAPYPVLHLLREADISDALRHYQQPQNIPRRNIKKARQLGASFFQSTDHK